MSTIEYLSNPEEFKKITSAVRSTIQSAFFGNNVKKINTLREAYRLAKKTPVQWN